MADRVANPYQYVSNELLENNDCTPVIQALKAIHRKWNTLGGNLNMPNEIITEIDEKYYRPDPFRQMSDLISAWIRRPIRELHPSWRVLCQALEKMGEIGLADKIAADHRMEKVHNQSIDRCKSANSSTAVSHIAPTVEDLEEQLHNLTAWELFATHLPEIDQSDITKISNEYRGVDRQKLELYKVWLDNCAYASWDHVIKALKKNKKNRLVAKIEEWLKTNPVCSELKSPEIAAKKRQTNHEHVNGQASGLEEPTNESTDGNDDPPELETNGGNQDTDDTPICPISLNPNVDIREGTILDSYTKAGGVKRHRHLVIVITNEYKFTNGQLTGIKEDRRKLYTVFGNEEMFHLVKLEDTHKQQMEEKLHKIRETLPQPVKNQYKSAFIIFSGHGCMTEDKKKSYIVSEYVEFSSLDDIIDSFEEKIGSAVPKFFLIDACRSVSKDIDKGGTQCVNSLYGYATQKGDVASMDSVKGSYWIQEVVNLLKLHGQENIPVVEIIEKAKKNVSEIKKQTPEVMDQLTIEGRSLCLKINQDYSSKEEMDSNSGDRGASVRPRFGKAGAAGHNNPASNGEATHSKKQGVDLNCCFIGICVILAAVFFLIVLAVIIKYYW